MYTKPGYEKNLLPLVVEGTSSISQQETPEVPNQLPLRLKLDLGFEIVFLESIFWCLRSFIKNNFHAIV